MIVFTNIKWKNFLATGNSGVEIDLSRNRTTILLGPSGSGKSTLLDAIALCLFNRPFRNIKKTQLVNSINGKKCVVEIAFTVGTKNYLVKRGIKPNIFEIYCNEELVNQDSHSRDYQQYLETNILKCNFKAFSQIVVLGASNFTPFMQLRPADRRIIIEGLLDIEIFSVMNSILKSRISNTKTEIMNTNYAINLAKEKIAVHQKYLEESRHNRSEKVKENIAKIKKNKQQIKTLNLENATLATQIQELESKLMFKSEVQQQINRITNIQSKIVSKVKKAKREIKFYEEHDECPTCHQKIQSDFKNAEISKNSKQIIEFESGLENAKKSLTKLSARLANAKVIEDQIQELQLKISKNRSTVDAIEQFIKKVAKDTIAIQSQVDEGNADDIKELNEKVQELEAKKEKFAIQRAINDTASNLLKDGGVKARIIKQYLPLINKYTNQFLTAMNFFIAFHMDEEFNETIKSRGRDNFAYENFSEGEKQRIDLALLFTWRKIAKMKNSVNANLLVLDEVCDSYLDTNATENVLQLINSDFFKNANIFVISHKENIADKFHASVRFTKKKNFSIIE